MWPPWLSHFDILAKDRASKEFNKVGDSAEKAGKKGHGFGLAMKAGMLVAVGAVAEFAKKSIEAAVQGQQSQARLEQALKSTGGSFTAMKPQIDALDGRMAKLGFTNDDVNLALGQMTSSLGSGQKAVNEMGLAADLAAFKHISLADASLVVAKAMEGQVRPLKQLAIDLPITTAGAYKLQQANLHLHDAQQKVTDILLQFPNAADKASKAHAKWEAAVAAVAKAHANLSAVAGTSQVIIAGLTKAIGGQATAASETLAGKVKALHAEFFNFQENAGNKLIPILTTVIDDFTSMVDWLGKNKAVMEPLIVVVGGLAAAVFVVNEAQKAWAASTVAFNVIKGFFVTETVAQTVATEGLTVAQTELDVAMTANPIGLVIVAIAALAAGLIYAYTHSKTFRTIVQATFADISAAAKFMWNDVLKPTFKFLVEAWISVAGAIIHGAASAFGWIPGLGGKLKAAAKFFDEFAKSAIGSLNGMVDKHITVTADLIYNAPKGGGLKASAGGNPLSAGEPSIIGERGWELFVPKVDGWVVTQQQAAAAAGSRTADKTRGMLGGPDMSETNGLLTQLLDTLRSQPREMQRLARTT